MIYSINSSKMITKFPEVLNLVIILEEFKTSGPSTSIVSSVTSGRFSLFTGSQPLASYFEEVRFCREMSLANLCTLLSLRMYSFVQIQPRMQGENLEKNNKLREHVEKIAELKNCSLNQLALAWVHHKGSDIVPIPGTSFIHLVLFQSC